MTSSRPDGMRCRLQDLCCLLFTYCVLWELPRSSQAAGSNSKYNQLNNLVQESCTFSRPNDRRYVLESSSLIHHSPSIHAIGPDTFPSPVPSPSPLAPLFPSDPPFTVPYSPAPGSLIIPTGGNCPINFTAIKTTLYQTYSDCEDTFSRYVGVAICCPQLDSLLRVMQGQHLSATGSLGFNNTEAISCFNEMEGFGINRTVCNVPPASLTVGTCPVTTVINFEQLVNISSLLQACKSIDPLRECVLKTCQTEVGNASLILAQGQSNAVDDCKSLVLSWLAGHSTPDQANTALRFLSSCAVNQVCPLVFNNTSTAAVASACGAPLNKSCCGRLNQMVEAELQSQMLITNEQAYKCANMLAVELQNLNVTSDLYTFCDVQLSDFSLQALKTEGCLLPSTPTDINITSHTFVCDLNDNVLALWPAPAPPPSPSISAAICIGYGLRAFLCGLTFLSLVIEMI